MLYLRGKVLWKVSRQYRARRNRIRPYNLSNVRRDSKSSSFRAHILESGQHAKASSITADDLQFRPEQSEPLDGRMYVLFRFWFGRFARLIEMHKQARVQLSWRIRSSIVVGRCSRSLFDRSRRGFARRAGFMRCSLCRSARSFRSSLSFLLFTALCFQSSLIRSSRRLSHVGR
jgi:hypothetical protein